METKEELRAALAEAQREAAAAKQRVEALLQQTDLSNEINVLKDLIERFRQIAPGAEVKP